MFSSKRLHNDESGQTALETAIILIAFVVVASVFAFTILSAGQASTQKGEKAIYAGLNGVQSTLDIKGAVIADGGASSVTDVVFTVALADGGDPVDLTAPTATTHLNHVVISYRDATQNVPEITDWTATFVGANNADTLLQQNELAEITVPLDASGMTALGVNTPFTIEVKPPVGAVLDISRTTPAAIDAVMELR